MSETMTMKAGLAHALARADAALTELGAAVDAYNQGVGATAVAIDKASRHHGVASAFVHNCGRERLLSAIVARLRGLGLEAIAPHGAAAAGEDWRTGLLALIDTHVPEGA